MYKNRAKIARSKIDQDIKKQIKRYDAWDNGESKRQI